MEAVREEASRMLGKEGRTDMNVAATGKRARGLDQFRPRRLPSRPAVGMGIWLGRDRSSGAAVLALALLLMTVQLIGPAIYGNEGTKNGGTKSADYGIFQRISDLDREEMSRADDPEVVSRVQGILGPISPSGYQFDRSGPGQFTERQLEVPSALTRSPVIYDALMQNPVVNNTRVFDWIFPPLGPGDQGTLNYIIFIRSGTSSTWKLGSIVPKVGLLVDSSIDKWVYADCDNDPSTGDATGNDIRVRVTFSRDLLERDWEASLLPLPPKLKFNNAGIRLEIEALETVNGGSALGGKVYVIKGISYQGKNYLWSIGVDLDSFMDRLVLRVQAKQWVFSPSLELIQQLFQPGGIDLRDLKMLQVLGPFTVSYLFDTPPEGMRVLLSVMRLEERALRDMAYVELGLDRDSFHERLVPYGRIVLSVKDMGSPIDGLEWSAGASSSAEDTISLSIRYTEFSKDLIDAHLEIPVLPHSLKLELGTKLENGRNLTVLDLTTPNGFQSLRFLEVLYPTWEPGGGTGPWNATEVRLRGIPSSVHVETVAYIPFVVDDGASNLNILDAFMRQLAGRVYRIGNVLREIPRSLAELPSRKGSSLVDMSGSMLSYMEFISTSGLYLDGPVDTISFQGKADGHSSISARLQGIGYYKGSFSDDGNDITIRIRGQNGLKVLASSPEADAWIELGKLPGTVRLRMSESLITYEGSNDDGPAGLPYLNYRYRADDLLFDADIKGIPAQLEVRRQGGVLEVSTGKDRIGSVELFVSNGTLEPPTDLKGQNFLSVIRTEGSSSLGLRMNDLDRLVYSNESAGFLEIGSRAGSNLYAIIDDRTSDLSIQAVLAPLPSNLHLDFPSVIDRTELQVPDITSVRTITEYSDIIISLGLLGEAPLSIAASLADGLIKAIGTYATGLSMSWELSEETSTLDLVVTLEKQGAQELEEARWTHGIWMEQSGLGEDSSVNGRIYLQGMPMMGEVNISFSELVISTKLNLKGYSPDFDWMLIRTSGVQDRDISLYATGLAKGLDITLDLMVYTDLSIGGSMVVSMDISVKDASGRPFDLGEMIASLRKAAPILSVRQMYLPEVPGRFSLDAVLENGVRANYSASRSLEYLYFKISKVLDGRWSQIYSIFHDLPTAFSVDITSNTEFTIRKPLPLQGLPTLDLWTEGNELDVFIEYDGTGFGQRGRYQIFAEDIGPTRTYYSGDDYIIDSVGIGFISLQLDRLPFMESFTLSSLTLLGRDLEHVRISSEMVFGAYPVFTLSEGQGGSVQIKVSGTIAFSGNELSPDLFFISLRTREVLGLDLITGLSIDKDTSALNMEESSGEVIVPAPLFTFWYWVFSQVAGGG
ncbi:MAG: hypothetical protein MUC62_02300 [Candidatus Thermoplasmatota archaeon]|jgi:hypothetical protein|nr:hypothetical protein [Candidatus Thermoplasmatota archaeon]